MKITDVLLFEIIPVSFRIDWLINRACNPTCVSPISPANSARGTNAATESMTITSTALDLISISVICRASSPLLGWLTNNDSSSTPSFLAQLGSNACSASINAAMPPSFWASATMCNASVVLPLDSGPKTSMTRPRGIPTPPNARSRDILPVRIPSMTRCLLEPSGIMAPSPNCFSMCSSAALSCALFSI